MTPVRPLAADNHPDVSILLLDEEQPHNREALPWKHKIDEVARGEVPQELPVLLIGRAKIEDLKWVAPRGRSGRVQTNPHRVNRQRFRDLRDKSEGR